MFLAYDFKWSLSDGCREKFLFMSIPFYFSLKCLVLMAAGTVPGSPWARARAVFPKGAFPSPVATSFPISHVPSPTGALVAPGSPQARGGTGGPRAKKKKWEDTSLSGAQPQQGQGEHRAGVTLAPV